MSLFLLLLVLPSVIADTYRIADETTCIPGKRFVRAENDGFVQECRKKDNFGSVYKYSVVVACRSRDNQESFELGESINEIENEMEGYQFTCTNTKKGTADQWENKMTACIMGEERKVVEFGQKSAIRGRECECNQDFYMIKCPRR